MISIQWSVKAKAWTVSDAGRIRRAFFTGHWTLTTNHFFCLATALLLLVAAPLAQADQYRSQVRAAPDQQAQQPQDLQKQLQMNTDPYAKAMLLREMAATGQNFAGIAARQAAA